MTRTSAITAPQSSAFAGTLRFVVLGLFALSALCCVAQAPSAPASASQPPAEKPLPGLDLSSIDRSVDPCVDMYKFACGRFAANHPIPPDQPEVDPFYVLFNVDTQELSSILEKAESGGASRSPDEQKIGDYFKACMDTPLIQSEDLTPLKPLLSRIDALTPESRGQLASLIGDLQRDGVNAFFGYGEQQDYKDATKQIAFIQQGGLGLPEKGYYFRTGDKDIQIRNQYVDHVAKMLTLSGSSPEQAQTDAKNILAMETALAKASLDVVDMREPEKTYHLQPIATLQSELPGFRLGAFEDAIHSPHVAEINNATPDFWPAMMQQLQNTDIATIKAYLRYQLLTAVARNLPKAFDEENFNFYGRILEGQPEQRARWKRCSSAVDGALGEALGKVYVEKYFAGDSKAKMLQMVHDIEAAMGRDIEQIDWMSPATKVKALEKLHAVTDKIGYPNKWRDYTKLIVKPNDALGNELRADAFENDRELNKVGKPVDKDEWQMSPPTVNAYYDDSMNDINFPAGILQPPFFDRTQGDAVNYGHIGVFIGHELTHGFDDEGRKFDAKGDLDNWWTPADLKNFTARTDCLANEYSSFTAVDDVKVNGKLTLGENTADNGGLLLAFMAYMQHARDAHEDVSAKIDGFTGPQRFYIGFAQNFCQNTRPEAIREQVLQDPHSPDRIRVDGAIPNQPGFAAAFGCKKPSPMVPEKSCRVW